MGSAVDRLEDAIMLAAIADLDDSDFVGLSALEEDEMVLLSAVLTPGGRVGDDSPFSASKTSNWVARAGGLPKYIREVAHALVRKGRPVSDAIRMAIGIIRNWAEGKGKGTSAAVKAAAAKTIAEWEAKRAKAKADNK